MHECTHTYAHMHTVNHSLLWRVSARPMVLAAAPPSPHVYVSYLYNVLLEARCRTHDVERGRYT